MSNKLTKKQKLLIEEGYEEKQVAAMSTKEINSTLKELKNAQKQLDNISPPEVDGQLPLFEGDIAVGLDKIGEQIKKAEIDNTPDMSSPEWNSYVMSLFTKDELIDGAPKVDAIARVARKVIGPFSTKTIITQNPALNNDYRAVCIVTLAFTDITIDGSADSCYKNTDVMFAKYPTAVAETRAYGRALRRALMLQTVAAEEKSSDTTDINEATMKISNSMLNTLKAMSQRLNIDLLKLALNEKFNITTVDEMTKKEALKMSDVMCKYSTKELEIPTIILN